MACIIDSWVPTASMTLWRPAPPVRSLTFRHTGLPAVVDDVSGAELAREPLQVGVSAHRDNAFSAQLVGRQHAEQTDHIVTDDRQPSCRGPASAATAPNQPVPSTSEAASRLGISSAAGRSGVDDQGAVGPRDAPVFGLRADAAHRYRVLARLWWPARQIWQVLSEAKNDPTTNCPGLIVVTSLPTSSTTPTYS